MRIEKAKKMSKCENKKGITDNLSEQNFFILRITHN